MVKNVPRLCDRTCPRRQLSLHIRIFHVTNHSHRVPDLNHAINSLTEEPTNAFLRLLEDARQPSCSNTAAIRRESDVPMRRVSNPQRLVSPPVQRDPFLGGEVGRDFFLPHVSFVAGRLLRHDMLLLEILVGPPTGHHRDSAPRPQRIAGRGDAPAPRRRSFRSSPAKIAGRRFHRAGNCPYWSCR